MVPAVVVSLTWGLGTGPPWSGLNFYKKYLRPFVKPSS